MCCLLLSKKTIEEVASRQSICWDCQESMVPYPWLLGNMLHVFGFCGLVVENYHFLRPVQRQSSIRGPFHCGLLKRSPKVDHRPLFRLVRTSGRTEIAILFVRPISFIPVCGPSFVGLAPFLGKGIANHCFAGNGKPLLGGAGFSSMRIHPNRRCQNPVWWLPNCLTPGSQGDRKAKEANKKPTTQHAGQDRGRAVRGTGETGSRFSLRDSKPI